MRNPQISVRRVADELGIPKISLHKIISDDLGMKKVCTRWVLKFLTSLQHINRVDWCEELDNCNQGPTRLFGGIVTEDETQIHHYDPLSQQEAKTWKKQGKRTPTRPQVKRSTRKLILTIFRDCEGVLLINFLSCGTAINGLYSASVLHRLYAFIREKRCGKLRRGVLLLHDNAPVHKFNITQTAIQYTGFAELDHPAYSPDLALSHYHLFSNLKNFLRDRNIETDDETITTMNHYLESFDFLETQKVDVIDRFV